MRPNLPEDNIGVEKIGRLFLRVQTYELNNDGHCYAIGQDLLNPSDNLIKIRLTTVEERSIDKPKEKLAKIGLQYGKGNFGRDTLENKAKTKATVLAFDDLIALDKEGSYRAHWSTTLSSIEKPTHILVSPVAHIELKEETDNEASRAFIESIQSNVNLNNIKSVQELNNIFISSLNPKTKDNDPQRPFAILNLRYNNEPIFALLPRIYPTMHSKDIVDPKTGKKKRISIPASGIETMRDILSGKRNGANGRETFALDLFRASYAALSNQGICRIFSEGENKKYVEQVFKGIKNNLIDVSLASGLSINFGPASAKKYLSESKKKYLSAFKLKREVGDDSEQKYTRNVNGYAPVVLSLMQFDDGAYFVVNAISKDPYPKTAPMNESDLIQSNATIFYKKFDEPTIIDHSINQKFEFTNKPLNDFDSTCKPISCNIDSDLESIPHNTENITEPIPHNVDDGWEPIPHNVEDGWEPIPHNVEDDYPDLPDRSSLPNDNSQFCL